MEGEGATAALSQISNILDSFIAKPKSIDGESRDSGISPKASPQRTQPLKHSAYIERLKTYGPGRWSVCGDPSPLECARWGWMVIEEDVLQCVTCKRVVYAALPSIRDRDAYKKFLNVLKSRIQEAHSDCCGWRKHPSPYSFTLPAILDTREDLHNLRNTVHSIAALNSALPYIKNAELMVKLEIGHEVILEFLGSSQVLDETLLTAALLALCGWTKSHGSTLRCNICQRCLGLWTFVTRAVHARSLQQREKEHSLPCSGKRKLQEDLLSSPEIEQTSAAGVENQGGKRLRREDTKEVRKRYSSSSESDEKESSDEEMDIDEVEDCESRIDKDRITTLNTKSGKVECPPMVPHDELENCNREAKNDKKSDDAGTNESYKNRGHSLESKKDESKASSETKSEKNEQDMTTTTFCMRSGAKTNLDKGTSELGGTESDKVQIDKDLTETAQAKNTTEAEKTRHHLSTSKSSEEIGDEVEKKQEIDKKDYVLKKSQGEMTEVRIEGKPNDKDTLVSDDHGEEINKPQVDENESRTDKVASSGKGCKEDLDNKSNVNKGTEVKQNSALNKGNEASDKSEGAKAGTEFKSNRNEPKSVLDKHEGKETGTEIEKSSECQAKTVSDKSDGKKTGSESEVGIENKAEIKVDKNTLAVPQPGLDKGESIAAKAELERSSDDNAKMEIDESVSSREETELDNNKCSQGKEKKYGSQSRVGFKGDNTNADSIMAAVEEDDTGQAESGINNRTKALSVGRGAEKCSSIQKKRMDSSKTISVVEEPKTPKTMSGKSRGNIPHLRSGSKRCSAENSQSPILLIGSSPSTEVKQVEKHVYLQPLKEHRYWCSWVTVRSLDELQDKVEQDEVEQDKAEEQKCKEGIVGYSFVCQQLKQAVLTKGVQWGSSVKYAGNVQGLRSIRTLLYDWSSNTYDENDVTEGV